MNESQFCELDPVAVVVDDDGDDVVVSWKLNAVQFSCRRHLAEHSRRDLADDVTAVWLDPQTRTVPIL